MITSVATVPIAIALGAMALGLALRFGLWVLHCQLTSRSHTPDDAVKLIRAAGQHFPQRSRPMDGSSNTSDPATKEPVSHVAAQRSPRRSVRRLSRPRRSSPRRGRQC